MRLRALLLCTTLLFPSGARADPVTAFIAGFQGIVTTGAVAGAIGGLTGFAYSAGAFLGQTLLGGIILNLGIAGILGAANRPKAPSIEEARVNSRLSNAVRWQMAGTCAVGGTAGIFGEYDEDGNFFYIIAHGDAELNGDPKYILDGIEVTVSDGTDAFDAGDVLTDDFCLNSDGEQYEGTGTRVPYFRIATVAPTSSSVVGTKPTWFTSKFTSLPADFKLSGVCYSIIKCKTVKPEWYSKVMRWRGPIGIGEPSVSLVGNFNRMYDPRNVSHDIDDSTTWTAGDGNPAIMWAWWRTHQFGRNRPMTEINWTQVAAMADICDETVLDRSSQPIPRYRCGVAFPDNKPRHECEAEILLTCDGFVVYDDDGKAWPRVGYYEAPTLSFSAARDIISAQTQIINDGEAAVDGVIVEYISPDHGYTKQPSAPWVNPNYYDASVEPNFLSIPILGIQDHNQAVRMAKALGLRSAPTRLANLVTNIKGILAKGERTIDLDYDASFAGDYEIATPVKEDPSGIATSFSVVPMQTDRYDLGAGEEGEPPQAAPALNIDDSLEVAANVSVTAETVATSSGAAVRLEATFDAPVRIDRAFRFRYAPTGQTVYEYFITDMTELLAYSAIVQDGVSYDVSWQTVTAGGRGSAWSSIDTVAAIANTTPPAALAAFTATGGAGQVTLDYTTADDANQAKVRIYQGTTTTFSSATLVATYETLQDTTRSKVITGLSAGTLYFWGVPTNGSNVEGTPSAMQTVTIT